MHLSQVLAILHTSECQRSHSCTTLQFSMITKHTSFSFRVNIARLERSLTCSQNDAGLSRINRFPSFSHFKSIYITFLSERFSFSVALCHSGESNSLFYSNKIRIRLVLCGRINLRVWAIPFERYTKTGG